MSTSTECGARSQIALEQIRSDFQVVRGKYPAVSACMVHLPAGVELAQEEWPEGFRGVAGYQSCPFGVDPSTDLPTATRHVRFQGPMEAVRATVATAKSAKAALAGVPLGWLIERLPQGATECPKALGWLVMLFEMALLPEEQSMLRVWRSDKGGRFDWRVGPPCDYVFPPGSGSGGRWAVILPDVARASEIAARELGHLCVAEGTKARRGQSSVGKAIAAAALLSQNPGMSDRAIAKKVGCSSSTLSRNDLYRGVRNAVRGGREVKRGYRTKGRHGRPGDIEAIDYCNPCRSNACPTTSRPERGTGAQGDEGPRLVPIAGSRFYREKCAECGELIRVQRDQVGTSPVCDACSRL